MYTNNDPRKSNHKKPGSEQNKKNIYNNNIAKTIPNRQYMTKETIIRTTTTNVHNILTSTIESKTLLNNICLQTVLPANNNKLTQTFPFQKKSNNVLYTRVFTKYISKNTILHNNSWYIISE